MTWQVFTQRQVTIDFVSRYMVETNIVLTSCFQKRVSSDEVGVDKWTRVIERVIIVAFCRIVNDSIRFGSQLIYQVCISNISNNQLNAVA